MSAQSAEALLLRLGWPGGCHEEGVAVWSGVERGDATLIARLERGADTILAGVFRRGQEEDPLMTARFALDRDGTAKLTEGLFIGRLATTDELVRAFEVYAQHTNAHADFTPVGGAERRARRPSS